MSSARSWRPRRPAPRCATSGRPATPTSSAAAARRSTRSSRSSTPSAAESRAACASCDRTERSTVLPNCRYATPGQDGAATAPETPPSLPPSRAAHPKPAPERNAQQLGCKAMQPTPEQIDAYRRDGFLVVERFLEPDEVDRLRERFHAC